jgi:hypothetical protein
VSVSNSSFFIKTKKGIFFMDYKETKQSLNDDGVFVFDCF